MEKILTVAVPAYNAERYLDKGLPSFLCGPLEDKLDVIVVDDGSTDGTAQIADGYAARYPHIFRVIHKVNGGHGSGINIAVAKAAGKYFRVVDADDWVRTENMEHYLRELEQADADVVLTPFHTVDMSSGKRCRYALVQAVSGKTYTPDELLPIMSKAAPWFCIHSIAYRTDFLQGTGLRFSEGIFYEDTEYALLPFAGAAKIRTLDIDIYEYMIGNVSQSVSVQSFCKRFAQLETVFLRILSYYARHKGVHASSDAFFQARLALLLGTYEKVLLAYLPDRTFGRRRAGDIRRRAGQVDPAILKLSAGRHSLLLLCNRIGLPGESLERVYAWYKNKR